MHKETSGSATPFQIIKVLKSRGFKYSESLGTTEFYVKTVNGKRLIVDVDKSMPLYDSNGIRVVCKNIKISKRQFHKSIASIKFKSHSPGKSHRPKQIKKKPGFCPGKGSRKKGYKA